MRTESSCVVLQGYELVEAKLKMQILAVPCLPVFIIAVTPWLFLFVLACTVQPFLLAVYASDVPTFDPIHDPLDARVYTFSFNSHSFMPDDSIHDAIVEPHQRRDEIDVKFGGELR